MSDNITQWWGIMWSTADSAHMACHDDSHDERCTHARACAHTHSTIHKYRHITHARAHPHARAS